MPLRRALLCGVILGAILSGAAAASPLAGHFAGRVTDAAGVALAGALVSFERGSPSYRVTVYADAQGAFRSPPLVGAGWRVRARQVGWQDLEAAAPELAGATRLDLMMERHTSDAAIVAQLPANRWYDLALQRLTPAEREQVKRQCTYCHQQGNVHTRVQRDPEEWRKVLVLMARMGGTISSDLRARLPELFNRAYALADAVPALTARLAEPGFVPRAGPEARAAVIEEWELGGGASMQHDVVMHPDGQLYSVDMAQDTLYRLDPAVPGGARESWPLPQGDLPLGGVFAAAGGRTPASSNARVGPHSLQVAPDGAIWITLALGNQLARFDPTDASWQTVALEHGYYPHTLRFDQRGRIWYTLAASNHLGMYDPAKGEGRQMRLPASSWGQELALRTMPFMLWLGRYVDLRGAAAESDGFSMPIPYGIDVAPDGVVWFSQLNEHRIGRIDPESLEITMLDTPFAAPRRLRFDSQGKLWIPSFSDSLVARFDPESGDFRAWELPIEPRGSETPYALHVDHRSDTVWICGTNSDTLIRFEPVEERFTVYPLPTRVTYTREISFDAEGRVWTSNSNVPTWQIEGGLPKVIRLDPNGLAPPRRVSVR